MTAPDRMRGIAGELILPAHEYQRDRRSWLGVRRSGLGASETAAVLGLSKWNTPLQVYLDKMDTSPIIDEAPSVAAQIGTDSEDLVAKWTMRAWPELGKIGPTPGLLAHPEHRWMLATLDRLLYRRGERNGAPLGVLEVKSTSRFNYEANWVDGVPPGYVQVQVQQQLAVSGLARGWVACWVRDERPETALKEPFLIEADPIVHEQLVEYAGAWWERHIVGKTPPPAVFDDASILNDLHVPNLDADPVIADDRLVEAVAEWLDAKERAKVADMAKTAAEVVMKDAMIRSGSNAVARDDGQLLVTWKRNRPARTLDAPRLREERPADVAPFVKAKVSDKLNVAAFKKAHPDLAAAHMVEKTTSTFDRKSLAKDHPELEAKYVVAKTSRVFDEAAARAAAPDETAPFVVTNTEDVFDVAAFTAAHPELAAQYTTTEPGAAVLRAVKGYDS